MIFVCLNRYMLKETSTLLIKICRDGEYDRRANVALKVKVMLREQATLLHEKVTHIDDYFQNH